MNRRIRDSIRRDAQQSPVAEERRIERGKRGASRNGDAPEQLAQRSVRVPRDRMGKALERNARRGGGSFGRELRRVQTVNEGDGRAAEPWKKKTFPVVDRECLWLSRMKHPVGDRCDAREVPVFVLHRREAERLEAGEGLPPKARHPLRIGLKRTRSESLEIRPVSSSRERM